jgi:hypothetical protein
MYNSEDHFVTDCPKYKIFRIFFIDHCSIPIYTCGLNIFVYRFKLFPNG